MWLKEFPIWSEIIWDRCGAGSPNGRYQVSHELIYQLGKPIRNEKSLGLLDVWRIPPSKATGHVCPFPERLVLNCLAPHAVENEIVIDPYMGSASVGVCCIDLGLQFVGIEKDQQNFDLSCKRIEKHYEDVKNGLGLKVKRFKKEKVKGFY